MRVLVAVDLKKTAERVVDTAGEWATRLAATLDLLYVDEFRTATPAYVLEPDLQGVLKMEWQRMQREDEDALRALLGRVPENVRGVIRVETGKGAAQAIVDQAPAYDLVIVATEGRTGLAYFWLGSVAEKVVRTSPKPVLVLRLPAEVPR